MGTRAFVNELAGRIEVAARQLRALTEGQTVYAFALYTSGQDDFRYVAASANTEEALRDPQHRWSPCDWGWHDFSVVVGECKLPPGVSDRAMYDAFVRAMRTADAAGAFGFGGDRERLLALVACGDMSEAFLQRGMKLLNSAEACARYVRDYTPTHFLNSILAEEPAIAAMRLVDLYRDLALGLEGSAVREARSRGIQADFDLNDAILSLKTAVVGDLLGLIEQYGVAAPFNQEGGMLSAETNLACDAVFLVRRCKPTDRDIERLQVVLAKRVALDHELQVTCTLAENIARVMHELRPRRFPTSVLHDTSNHLVNPAPFIR